MNGAYFAVQDALYDALTADAAVQALLGTPARIYDHVQPDAAFPFVTIGAFQAERLPVSGQDGMQYQAALHCWSRARGSKEVKQIMQALHQRLHGGVLTVSGQQFVLCRLQSASAALDDDGLTYHGLAYYRIVTRES